VRIRGIYLVLFVSFRAVVSEIESCTSLIKGVLCVLSNAAEESTADPAAHRRQNIKTREILDMTFKLLFPVCAPPAAENIRVKLSSQKQ